MGYRTTPILLSRQLGDEAVSPSDTLHVATTGLPSFVTDTKLHHNQSQLPFLSSLPVILHPVPTPFPFITDSYITFTASPSSPFFRHWHLELHHSQSQLPFLSSLTQLHHNHSHLLFISSLTLGYIPAGPSPPSCRHCHLATSQPVSVPLPFFADN